MNTLHNVAQTTNERPRFDDEMVNSSGPIRMLTGSIANEVAHAESEDACADGSRRDGHGERRLMTRVGTTTPRIPEPRRGMHFQDDLFSLLQDRRTVVAVVSDLQSRGRPQEDSHQQREGEGQQGTQVQVEGGAGLPSKEVVHQDVRHRVRLRPGRADRSAECGADCRRPERRNAFKRGVAISPRPS
jgi:hypothetical protein